MISVHNLTRIPAAWLRDICSNPGCQKTRLAQVLAKRHTISLGDERLCGLDCFEHAVRRKLAGMTPRFQSDIGKSLRTPLGLLLLSRGVLSTERLQIALECQRASRRPIGDVVQELGFATPAEITAAVAAQWACPVFAPRSTQIPSQLSIPRRLLEKYELLPMHFVKSGRRLLVAFVRRVRYHALRTIEHVASCKTEPCFITENEYRACLQSVESRPEREIVFDRVAGLNEIVTIWKNYLEQTGAEVTRFGLFCDYLWVRMWATKELDLLFKLRESA